MISQSISKKQFILDTALQLFVISGFHGTPTSLIAREAEVSNGTLFHYFPTKEILIKELYTCIRDGLRTRTKTGLEKIAGIRGIVKHLWIQELAWALENPNEYFYIYQFRFSHYARLINNLDIGEWDSHYIDILDRAKSKRLIKPLPSPLLLLMVNQQIHALVCYYISHPGTASNHDLNNTTFEIFWSSIKLVDVS